MHVCMYACIYVYMYVCMYSTYHTKAVLSYSWVGRCTRLHLLDDGLIWKCLEEDPVGRTHRPPWELKKLSGFLFRSTRLVVSRSWLKGRGPNSPPSLRKSALKFCQLRQKLKSLAKQTKRAWPSTSFGCSGTLREGSRAVPVVTDGPFPKFLCCKIKFWFWGNTGII